MLLCYISTKGRNKVRGWTPGGQIRHQDHLLEGKWRESEGAQDEGSRGTTLRQPQPLPGSTDQTWWWCTAVPHNSFDHKDWWQREVDIYSNLGRNVKYSVRMSVETDDYIFLKHFWPSSQEVTYPALVLEEVAAVGRGLSSWSFRPLLIRISFWTKHRSPGKTSTTQGCSYQRGLENLISLLMALHPCAI